MKPLVGALPAELPELSPRAGFEPAAPAFSRRSNRYLRHRPNLRIVTTHPITLRRGISEKRRVRNLCSTVSFASGLRPHPAELVFPAGSPYLRPLVGGGSNSLLSPPARTNQNRVMDKTLLFAAQKLPAPRNKQDNSSLPCSGLSRGNKRKQVALRRVECQSKYLCSSPLRKI